MNIIAWHIDTTNFYNGRTTECVEERDQHSVTSNACSNYRQFVTAKKGGPPLMLDRLVRGKIIEHNKNGTMPAIMFSQAFSQSTSCNRGKIHAILKSQINAQLITRAWQMQLTAVISDYRRELWRVMVVNQSKHVKCNNYFGLPKSLLRFNIKK